MPNETDSFADLYVITHPTVPGWFVAGDYRCVPFFTNDLDRVAAFRQIDAAAMAALITGMVVLPLEEVKGKAINGDGAWVTENLA